MTLKKIIENLKVLQNNYNNAFDTGQIDFWLLKKSEDIDKAIEILER